LQIRKSIPKKRLSGEIFFTYKKIDCLLLDLCKAAFDIQLVLLSTFPHFFAVTGNRLIPAGKSKVMVRCL
jgi:hypothetical protein